MTPWTPRDSSDSEALESAVSPLSLRLVELTILDPLETYLGNLVSGYSFCTILDLFQAMFR